jgi:hypothetical protein
VTITELKCPSWQGRNLKLSLQSANLIVGNPFSGKSAIGSALRLGMYGVIASLGKEHSATFKPCSDDKELFCRLTFDNGMTNSVTISRDSDGRYSKSMDLQVGFPDVMMDINEYFKLTGQRQLAYVLERVDLKKMGYDESELLKDMQLPENGNEVAIRKWYDLLMKGIEWRNKQKQNICLWMKTLMAQLETADKEAKDTIKTQSAVVSAFKTQDEPKDVSAEREKARQASQAADLAAAIPKDTKRNELAVAVDAAEKKVREAKDDIDEIDGEITRMKKFDRCPTCLNEGTDWRKAWLKMKNANRKEVEADLVGTRKALGDAKNKLAAFDKKPHDPQAKKLEKAKDEAWEKFDLLDKQHTQWTAHQQNKEAVTKAKEKIGQAEAEQVVIKHMKAQLEKHQQSLAEKAFGTLLKIARKFTDGILNSPLEYKDGDFGRRVSEQDRKMGMDAPVGRWIAHEVFSGTEKLLVYAGLQISLCQNSPAKILIFDEMQRTGNKRQAIVRRLLELVKDGTLSQFLLVDNEAEPYGVQAREMNIIKV